MSRMEKQHVARAKEAGLVSILITMVLMIVVSLIVLGLAQISRRNQRQVLDRQLSTQAFYAAETAVNDVTNLFKTTAAGTAIPAKSDCTAGSGATATYYSSLIGGANLNPADNVKYTCVIVDPTPPTLLYGSIGSTSTVVPISSTGANIASVKLVFQSKDSSTTPAATCPGSTNNVFSATSTWTCGYGVLRVDLVPTSGNLDVSTLQSSLITIFLVPQRSGGGNSVVVPTSGNRFGVACTNSNCTVTLTGLNAPQYHMRVSSIYKDVALQVSAADASSNSLDLKNAQALVDATGKAQDVLRRIQVRVPIQSTTNQLSDYALQSSDALCKRFVVMDNYFDSVVTGVTSTNPLCAP